MNTKLLSMLGQVGSMFGVGLMEIASEREDVVVLSADMSTPAGLDKYKAAYPERFINVGIAEQNMIGIAAGLADEGYLPICVAQACFLSMRAFEQVRQYVGYMRGKMILVGIGAGVSLQYMGNTHFALEDMALMRTVPGLNVVAPCDAVEAVLALNAAIKSDAPTYIRLNAGLGTPIVNEEAYDFEIGRAHRLGEAADIQIIATGCMVNTAKQVAAELSKRDVAAEVVDMHTVKPLDESSTDIEHARLIVTIEEHSVIGGLGSAVATTLAERGYTGKFVAVGAQDRFLPVGSYAYILQHAGLDVDSIVNRIVENLK